MVMMAKELHIEIERRMDVQTLDDDSIFSNSDVDENENNDENNSNSNHGNNSNNNNSNNKNEIITKADYSDCSRIRDFPLFGLFSTPFTRASPPS
jgi:hypothetical protein